MPEGWMKEMQGKASEGSEETMLKADDEDEKTEQRKVVSEQMKARGAKNVQSNRPALNLQHQLFIGALSALMAAGYVYFMSRKGGKDPNALRSVTASKTIRTNVASVYEYISTPDFRTEWHMGAVEVAGPAIDHSAVTGELFSEEMNFGGHTWHVDWTVLERQFPTSASTHFAEFVLEGKAKRGNGQEQRWVESVRIKGDKNQEARAVLVEMEVAVSGEGVRADEQGKLLRRSISRGLKESLKMLRQRIEN